MQPEFRSQHREGQQKTPSADQTLPDCQRPAPVHAATVALLRLGDHPHPCPSPALRNQLAMSIPAPWDSWQQQSGHGCLLQK